MSKDSSGKVYQNKKEKLLRKLVTDIKTFLKKEIKKSSNTVVKDTKTYQEMKNRSSLTQGCRSPDGVGGGGGCPPSPSQLFEC